MTDAPQPQASDGPAPPDDAAHLLIVDDDRRIRELLRRYLLAEGYRVTTAGTAAEATTAMRSMAFDLVVLDVMMPGEDGFTFATRLRGDPGPLASVPILMLTAKTEFEERVLGFEIGVDDYLGKPFEPRELSLRIASILRRARPPIDSGRPTQVQFGPFSFDIERGELRENGEVVRITEREREMLRLLSGNAGWPPSRARRCRARAGPATSARSTCRSTDCGARSRRTRRTRSICRPSAAPAIVCWWTDSASRLSPICS